MTTPPLSPPLYPDDAAMRRATWQMMAVTLFWGGFFVFGKMAVAEAGPMVVASLRFWLAGAVLAVVLVIREPGALKISLRDWGLALALGVTGVAGYNALCFYGFQYAPASDGAMIAPSLNPALTALLAAWFFQEPLTRPKVIGQVLAIAGVVLIFAGPMLTAQGSGDRGFGDLLFVLAAAVWSIYTLLGKVAGRRFSPLASTTYSSVLGALIMLPFAWGDLMKVQWGTLSLQFWGIVGFIALFSTVAAFLLWYDAIRAVGASRTATFHLLVPIYGVALSAVLLGERPGVLQVVGMGLAIAGVYWASKAPAR
jgi:drug/metabolite transporter (DMT)-like permease